MTLFFSLAWALIASFFTLALLAGSGWLIARTLMGLNDRSLLLLFVPICGIAFASVWLNAVGRIVNWQFAVASFALVGVLGCVRMFRQWRSSIHDAEWRNSLNRGSWILGVCLIIGFVGGIFDESWHLPLIGLIANGNWPAALPCNPDIALFYHYGFDIVVAFMVSAGVYASFASDILTAIFQTCLLLIVYRFSRACELSVLRSWIATGIFAFAGSAAWILRPFRSMLPESFATVFPFHGSMINAMFLLTYTKSLLIAAALLIGVLLLHHLGIVWHRNIRGAIAVALFLLASSLSSETLFVVFVPVCCLAYLFETQPLSRIWRFLLLVATAGLVLVQGGMLSSFIAKLLGFGDMMQDYARMSVHFSLMHQTFFLPINFFSVDGAIRAAFELAGFIVLVWAAWRWRQRDKFFTRLLIVASASFFLPLFVHYDLSDRDLFRFWIGTILITGIFGGITIVKSIKSVRVLSVFAVFLCIGGIASTVLSNFPITWMGRQPPVIISRALLLPYLKGETRLPSGVSVWTDAPSGEREQSLEMKQIPLVFGAYAESCQDLIGRFMRPDCEEFRLAPSEEGLDRLGADYLLVGEDFFSRIRTAPWFGRLRLISTYTDPLPAESSSVYMPGKPGLLRLLSISPSDM